LRRTATLEWIDGLTRIRLDPSHDLPPGGDAQEQLRLVVDATPYPIWRENADGQIVWRNQAYEDMCQRRSGEQDKMDDPLFPQLKNPSVANSKARVSVPTPTKGQRLWFDVTAVEVGDEKLGFAADVNAVVDAEVAQRNFVQTLAKTFAQLSIGLAIFDRNRQLALFNPALIDLTSLPADFLSARPTLLNFFDRLRDQRVMPEPKDYNSWRQQFTELAEAASKGRYHETWSLPSGSVYSVSGRPHPDGAVAFLFEDITAEITLTRRFRAELELSQAVMDQLEQAIVVFSADGTLTYSNTGFHQLWEMDPDQSFAQTSIQDAARVWQDKGLASPVWGRLTDFVRQRGDRRCWSATVCKRGSAPIECRVAPIQHGATMVSFHNLEGHDQKTKQPAAFTT
ncbi:MAG: PAS-domain containing protein, partial [Paracoccaceae bacterium]